MTNTTDKNCADALTPEEIQDRLHRFFSKRNTSAMTTVSVTEFVVELLAGSPVEQPARLTAKDAIAAIETFEIVGENNDSREPNADDRFILTEFIAHLFGGYSVEQPAAAPIDGMPSPVWWINHGSHGQITTRSDEAERARDAGASVHEYQAIPASSPADERAAMADVLFDWQIENGITLTAGVLTDLVRRLRAAHAASTNEKGAEVSGECFIVIGHGESDIPEAKIVTHREDLLDAVLGMIYGSPSDAPADARALYAQDLEDEDQWMADKWSCEFEIGGIVVWHVGLHPLTTKPAMAAEAVAKIRVSHLGHHAELESYVARSLPMGVYEVYAAPQPAHADTQQRLAAALRLAREELSYIDWQNDPPTRITDLFSTIDALLTAQQERPTPSAARGQVCTEPPDRDTTDLPSEGA